MPRMRHKPEPGEWYEPFHAAVCEAIRSEVAHGTKGAGPTRAALGRAARACTLRHGNAVVAALMEAGWESLYSEIRRGRKK